MSTIYFSVMNLLMLTAIHAAPSGRAEVSHDERARLVALLVQAAHDTRDEVKWIGIHAAEALAVLGHPETVVETFRQRVNSPQPGYRVCVWRVLARAEAHDDDRRRHVERIRRVLLDPQAPDHVHAMEALAKLVIPIIDLDERRCVLDMADSETETGSPFALWRLAQANERAHAVDRLMLLSKSDDTVTRLRALYVLARLRRLPAATQQSLIAALAIEPEDSRFFSALTCAAGGPGVARLAGHAAPGARYSAAMQLAEEPCDDNGPLLWSLVDDVDADVRVAAAFAILRSSKTQPRP